MRYAGLKGSCKRSKPPSCRVHHPRDESRVFSSHIDVAMVVSAMQMICMRRLHSNVQLNSSPDMSYFYRGRCSVPPMRDFSTAVMHHDDHDDDDDDCTTNAPYTEKYSADNRDIITSQRHCKTCTCKDTSSIDVNSEVNEHHTNEHHTQKIISQHSETLQFDDQNNRNIQFANENDGSMIQSDIQNQSITSPHLCHPYDPLIHPNTPLPPPLPKPKYSFKCRTLPSNLLAFNSTTGKERFLYSLQSNNAEAYFPLSQQFLNQMDPAFCGVSTLILVLNALAMDPNVRWRGGWRWYGDESMLLERCCLDEERVRREGITMEQYCGLARCQGVNLVMKRPLVDFENDTEEEQLGDNVDNERKYDLAEFRRDVINAVQYPPKTDDESDDDTDKHIQSAGGYFIVTSFARSALQQTGDGHFSPIAAYHPPTDSCLVLDVARFKYAPYWVSVEELYNSMIPKDKATGKSRGWILMYPPSSNASNGGGKKKRDSTKSRSIEELEGKRPAACVPLAGTGESICAVEKIKVDYCSVRNNP